MVEIAIFAAMSHNRSIHIAIVGTGNVATHFALALACSSYHVAYICSRSQEAAEQLARQINNNLKTTDTLLPACQARTAILPQDSAPDIVFFCTADDAILPQAQRIFKHWPTAIFVHNAGSVPVHIFNGLVAHYGVVYPLQTLSKWREVDFLQVPLFVEGSDAHTTAALELLARNLSQRVQRLDSIRRRNLHLAAVFACNFPNALFGIAEGLLSQAGVERNMLEPLLRETLSKFLENGAARAQTGPAARGDKSVMERHTAMLSEGSDEQNIYQILSDYIYKKRSGRVNVV